MSFLTDFTSGASSAGGLFWNKIFADKPSSSIENYLHWNPIGIDIICYA